MSQFGGKDSKRHFTVVIEGKEHGLYVSSTPSLAAKKAVTKLCAANKGKKVEFSIREITQGSKKKTYGPYSGYIEKLKEPIELKGRVIKYKPVAKLSGKSDAKKGGMRGGGEMELIFSSNKNLDELYEKPEFKEALVHLSKDKTKIFKSVQFAAYNNSEERVVFGSKVFIGNSYLPTERKTGNYNYALLNLRHLLNQFTKNSEDFFILKPKDLELDKLSTEDLANYINYSKNFHRLLEYEHDENDENEGEDA